MVWPDTFLRTPFPLFSRVDFFKLSGRYLSQIILLDRVMGGTSAIFKYFIDEVLVLLLSCLSKVCSAATTDTSTQLRLLSVSIWEMIQEGVTHFSDGTRESANQPLKSLLRLKTLLVILRVLGALWVVIGKVFALFASAT